MNRGKLALPCAGLLILALAFVTAGAETQFAFKTLGDKSLGLSEGQRPVLVYQSSVQKHYDSFTAIKTVEWPTSPANPIAPPGITK